MEDFTTDQIRNFRLRSHHLDREYAKTDAIYLAEACGFQNSPPGAWEAALFHRIPTLLQEDADRLLYEEKSLLQAWSFRGAPVVFPTAAKDIFLSALVPEEGEKWIYTDGIGLALDFLQMDFDQVLRLLLQVIPRLEEVVLESKNTLDQTLARWICPLRPCSFLGLVVFGRRNGIYPTFTSPKSWVEASSQPGTAVPPKEAVQKLVRKYLHCYGPSTPSHMAAWLGCTPRQARRMWDTVADELESAKILGKKAFFLASDRQALESPAPLKRDLVLIDAHDPFLDQRDRQILQPEKSFHRRIWRTVANPGAILYRGEVIGIWNAKKQKNGLDFVIELWKIPDHSGETEASLERKLSQQAEAYAAFRKQKVGSVGLKT